MINFMIGAIAMASSIAGLVFLRFFQRTRERIFLFFAASFWLDSAGRVFEVIGLSDNSGSIVYLIRLIAYGLIIVGILDKNLPRRMR